MEPDLWSLYRQMLRSRRFEEVVKDLWERGEISGEMHLGIGEEAVAVGVVARVKTGDALVLDHRGTPPLVARGVDLVLLLREFLGRGDGLCCGMGGHIHLFSPEHYAASSGIIGASGPMAAGFGLAAQYRRAENVAVAFFGEGAMNQGMLMESLNLAVVWRLPVLFVCKDNKWAMTSHSNSVMGGSLIDRARSFGMPTLEVDGSDVVAVWRSAGEALERARNGDGPTFLLAHCSRLEGHLLGDPLLRIARNPIEEMKKLTRPLLAFFSATKGASLGERIASMGTVSSMIGRLAIDQHWNCRDPIHRIQKKLRRTDEVRFIEIGKEVDQEIQQAVETALSSLEEHSLNSRNKS